MDNLSKLDSTILNIVYVILGFAFLIGTNELGNRMYNKWDEFVQWQSKSKFVRLLQKARKSVLTFLVLIYLTLVILIFQIIFNRMQN